MRSITGRTHDHRKKVIRGLEEAGAHFRINLYIKVFNNSSKAFSETR